MCAWTTVKCLIQAGLGLCSHWAVPVLFSFTWRTINTKLGNWPSSLMEWSFWIHLPARCAGSAAPAAVLPSPPAGSSCDCSDWSSPPPLIITRWILPRKLNLCSSLFKSFKLCKQSVNTESLKRLIPVKGEHVYNNVPKTVQTSTSLCEWLSDHDYNHSSLETLMTCMYWFFFSLQLLDRCLRSVRETSLFVS